MYSTRVRVTHCQSGYTLKDKAFDKAIQIKKQQLISFSRSYYITVLFVTTWIILTWQIKDKKSDMPSVKLYKFNAL